MGQYWKTVNLDKREFICPHKLGAGLKLREQLASRPGVGAALIILTAAMPHRRGGGDLDLPSDNRAYNAIAKRTIGRWAGDRIAMVGDYASDTDLEPEHQASRIYNNCVDPEDECPGCLATGTDKSGNPLAFECPEHPMPYKDITDDVARVIEHELRGRFEGEGWKKWVRGR